MALIPFAVCHQSYGQVGVERVIQILRDEMIMGMRLIGAPSLKDLKPEMLTLRNLSDHLPSSPRDTLASLT